jgi:AbrB family looped-hinge helix DNA binding protein
MSAAQSKITSKYQTVIPKVVRKRLGLKTGDMLRFRFAGEGPVTVEKVPQGEDDPFASFHEWGSEEDERLYRDL